MKKTLVLAALLAASIPVALAGNATAGQAKAAACAACHNADGNSVVATFPKLAGQNESYIVKQLKDFQKSMQSADKKEGRFEATMSGMSMTVAEADMADVAAYFAAQKPQFAAVKEELREAGRKLYNGGDASRGIPACTACHGPTGAGVPAAGFPRLGGQHPDYTIKQLNAFRHNERSNDANSVMRDIAKKLNEDQIAAVANYVVGLH